jgi:hypothetical protein
MLTDVKLRNLKPREKQYKVADRDGLYVAVLPSGTVSFRYNYRINGRQETLVLGKYESHGMGLKDAREKLGEAKKILESGTSPARHEKRQRNKRAESRSFGEWGERWLQEHVMAESTRDMRRSVFERDLREPFGKLKMCEITDVDLRALCDRIVGRGAPATAVHAREIVMMIFRFANERGNQFENPSDKVKPSSIATFVPRDRALSPAEIRLMYTYLGHIGTMPTIRLAVM